MKFQFQLMASLLCLCPSLSYAETQKRQREAELFSFETRLFPSTPLRNPASENLPENAQIRPYMGRFNLQFKPLIRNQGHTLIGSSLSYERFAFGYSHWDKTTNPEQLEALHGIGVSLFWRQQFPHPLWSSRLFLTPGFRSDFYSLSMEAFKIQGGLIFSRAVGSAQWGIGLVVLDDYGTVKVYPGISYEQIFRQKHKISLRVPTSLTYSYKPSADLEMGLSNRVNGISARIEEPGSFHGKNGSVSSAMVGPQIQWRFTPQIYIGAETGWAYRNKFEIINSNGTVYKDYDLKQSWYSSMGIKFII